MNTERASRRAVIFIDGQNLFRSAKEAFGHSYPNYDPLGRLRFIEGPHPGSNLTYVEAPDLATIACLQHRLNELNENIHIEIR